MLLTPRVTNVFVLREGWLLTKQLELNRKCVHLRKKSHQPRLFGTRTGSAIGEPLSISAELRYFATAWRLANLDETTTRDIEMPRNSILKLSWPLVRFVQFVPIPDSMYLGRSGPIFLVYLNSSFVEGQSWRRSHDSCSSVGKENETDLGIQVPTDRGIVNSVPLTAVYEVKSPLKTFEN